ncbi:MAG TPA: nicotinate phosphoribosyltransferase [Spirochaetia bacterium]|nr:nicotinate phosphoribosyltransferase [Spirochaetia bacterium]
MNCSALFTDFYELTMAQGYFTYGMRGRAVFDMFFRRQPFGGGFSVFAGLEPLLKTLEGLHFDADDIDYLRSLGIFTEDFLTYLSDFSFSGDVYAFPEGSIVFPQEPLVRIHGDFIEAQIIEGLLLNVINFQTLIATKTARVLLASSGCDASRCGKVLEFGLRRAQGPDGAMSASRAAFIGGADSTSNSLAGKRYGIPVSGTMAHSWVMAFGSEAEAFDRYAELYPEKSVFLIDTYNTLESGIIHAIEIGKKLAKRGLKIGVRLDSGDIQYLSRRVRKALDEAGLKDAFIVASNELSEEIIQQLVSSGAPIDVWGVGTHMVTGGNDSSLTGVYKLAAKEENGIFLPTMKVSDNPEKSTNPGIKQVWRLSDDDGCPIADVLALEGETVKPGIPATFHHPSIDYRHFHVVPGENIRPMLVPYMKNGRICVELPSLKAIQENMRRELTSFDDTYKRIINPHVYKVSITERLMETKVQMVKHFLGDA